jgi:hypothetical protein
MHYVYKNRFFHFSDFIVVWGVCEFNGVSEPPTFNIHRGERIEKIDRRTFAALMKNQKLNTPCVYLDRYVRTKRDGFTQTVQSVWECQHYYVVEN